MKFIPVTPELIAILENAAQDTVGVIDEVLSDIEGRSFDSMARCILREVEQRRQLLAVTKDILERYKD